jgi:hypothetical protein
MNMPRPRRLPRLLAVLPLLAASACARRQVDGDVQGEPLRPPRPDFGTDGGRPSGQDGGATAATDAATNPALDAAAPPDGGGGPPPDAAAGKDPILFNPACEKCEARSCRRHPDFGDLVGNCFDEVDPGNPRRVGRGPRPDLSVSEACRAVVKCVRASKCSIVASPVDPAMPPPADPAPCYCGDASGTECVVAGNPRINGPCRAEIEAASGSSVPLEVMNKLYATIWDQPPMGVAIPNAAGLAMQLVICDNSNCSTPCAGYNSCFSPLTGLDTGSPECATEQCLKEGVCVSDCWTQRYCPEPDGGAPAGAAGGVDAGPQPRLPRRGGAGG